MSKDRDFKGVWIPKHIWLNPQLSPIEKLFLAEIDSLDNDEEKGCFASNEYFGNFFGISEGSAANIISSLRKRGYVVQVFFNGRVRGISLHENVKAGFMPDGSSLHENVKAGFTKKGKQVSRKREHTNIVDNKEDNKEREGSAGASDPLLPPFKKVGEIETLEAEKEKPLPPVAPAPPPQNGATRVKLYDYELPGVTLVDSVSPITKPEKTGREQAARERKEKELDLAARVIEHLNAKAGRDFRVNAGTTAKGIIGRAKEGFTEADMMTVIDFKTAEWKNDPQFYQYLRPSTLFCPKHFEEYLQAAKPSAQPQPNGKTSSLNRSGGDLSNYQKPQLF